MICVSETISTIFGKESATVAVVGLAVNPENIHSLDYTSHGPFLGHTTISRSFLPGHPYDNHYDAAQREPRGMLTRDN